MPIMLPKISMILYQYILEEASQLIEHMEVRALGHQGHIYLSWRGSLQAKREQGKNCSMRWRN